MEGQILIQYWDAEAQEMRVRVATPQEVAQLTAKQQPAEAT